MQTNWKGIQHKNGSVKNAWSEIPDVKYVIFTMDSLIRTWKSRLVLTEERMVSSEGRGMRLYLVWKRANGILDTEERQKGVYGNLR